MPHFCHASQNIAVATMLVRSVPKAIEPEVWRLHRELRELLEAAAVQQVESSLA